MVKICPKCNMKNSNNSTYCVNCSNNIAGVIILQDKEVDTTIDNHYNFEPDKEKPPMLIVYFIVGFLATALFTLVFFGVFVYAGLSKTITDSTSAAYTAFLGTLFFVIAIFCFNLMYGLWKGKSWAWKLIVVSIFIQILLGIVSLAFIITLIVNIIILALLFTADVRMFFESNDDKKTSIPWVKLSLFAILFIVVFLSLFYIYST